MAADRLRRGSTAVAALAVVATGVAAPSVAAPAVAVAPARSACEWTPDILPLPDGTFHGRVTAGAGDWLAGVAGTGGPKEAVRWRDGAAERLGPAFGLDTTVAAVNGNGVVVGTATAGDGMRHAFRHRGGRYERLPTSGGSSTALDVNARGDVVGRDGDRLVVWPVTGPARPLETPGGEAPYGRAAIDDDGTVAARTGHVAEGTLRWRTYTWSPEGARTPLPAGDVQDLRQGRLVGATGDPAAVTRAAAWRAGQTPRPYLGGTTVVAANDDGVVVGAGWNDEPLLWHGVLPTPLPAPPAHTPGGVTAVNTHEAGGFTSPVDGEGPVPLRWRCR